MDPERWRTFLTEQQERVRDRTRRLEAELKTLVRARRGESDDDEHDPEGETLSARWSMLAGLLESAREDEWQAERAMARLASGAYGVCDSCGRPIPFPQLEVRPFRERCVSCSV